MKQSKLKIQIVFYLLIILALSGPGCKPDKDPAKLDMESLQGEWQLVYQQQYGEKVPDEKAAEMFHAKMVFTGDKFRYTADLPGFDLTFSYKLHPDQQPKTIDLRVTDTSDKKGIGKETFGIYRLEGDTLKICHSLTNRPIDFNAAEGSVNCLIVLKRKAPRSN